MVATSRSTPNKSEAEAADTTGPAEFTARQAAQRVARLFPEVYRRYHWAQRVRGADLPVTRRALEVLQHLSSSGPLTVGEKGRVAVRLRRRAPALHSASATLRHRSVNDSAVCSQLVGVR
jgi:hypothetical protein